MKWPVCSAGEWVGLRPLRTKGVRLEMDPQLVDGGRRWINVIHNYGHGGSGVTLSWGCAKEVVDLALPLFGPPSSRL